MITPRWAEKEQRRDSDRRRAFWSYQSWLIKMDARATLGAAFCVAGIAFGTVVALAVRTVLPATSVLTAIGAVCCWLLISVGILCAAAGWREGFFTRQLALPAIYNFGAFAFVMLSGRL